MANMDPDPVDWNFEYQLPFGYSRMIEDENNLNLPCRFLPERNPGFIGREKELQDMREELKPLQGNWNFKYHELHMPKEMAETSAANSLNLVGLGGIGKSQLALEYAFRCADEYDAIFWMKADSAENLHNSFDQAAIALGIPDAKYNVSIKNQIMLLAWLERTKKRWLLIFDNMWAFNQAFWPFCRGNGVTITAGGHALEWAEEFHVPPFPLSTAADFIRINATGEVQSWPFISSGVSEAATELARELCCYPMALAQACSLAAEKDMGLHDLLVLCREDPNEIIEHVPENLHMGYDYPMSDSLQDKFGRIYPPVSILLSIMSFFKQRPLSNKMEKEILRLDASRLWEVVAAGGVPRLFYREPWDHIYSISDNLRARFETFGFSYDEAYLSDVPSEVDRGLGQVLETFDGLFSRQGREWFELFGGVDIKTFVDSGFFGRDGTVPSVIRNQWIKHIRDSDRRIWFKLATAELNAAFPKVLIQNGSYDADILEECSWVIEDVYNLRDLRDEFYRGEDPQDPENDKDEDPDDSESPDNAEDPGRATLIAALDNRMRLQEIATSPVDPSDSMRLPEFCVLMRNAALYCLATESEDDDEIGGLSKLEHLERSVTAAYEAALFCVNMPYDRAWGLPLPAKECAQLCGWEARLASRRGDFARAKRALLHRLDISTGELDVDLFAANSALGNLYLSQGKLELALKYHQKCVAHSGPPLAQRAAWLNCGRTLTALGRFDEADEMLAAAEAVPCHEEIRLFTAYHRAVFFLARGHILLALAAFKLLIEAIEASDWFLDHLHAACLYKVGCIYTHSWMLNLARHYLEQSLGEHARRSSPACERVRVLFMLSEALKLALSAQDAEDAASYKDEAARIYQDLTGKSEEAAAAAAESEFDSLVDAELR
ncbi:hypothetical protein B0T26DRAFT_877331 [Lasiosphaeria miniovina]|uniref:NB-ARC domain-containing protein n=1 Tax=Lasiosphaeria miniovina TaxID=1954250 RepID=A0AA40DGE4_9PEZI|nr:uncharacterized protein B0T26DRAFT_877331 [Lasiosphaeria miniovina]KAK0702125.1 hypothetical protein B0T26DRAFT_877331 [Lasiosphaeria miniovina]